MDKSLDYRGHPDPEYRRWGQKYPEFPGAPECLRLLRLSSVRGSWVDIVCHELTVHAGECLPELVEAFNTEADYRIRSLILTTISEAKLPAAIPFLAEVVRSGQPPLAAEAEWGLSRIDTREARTALWEATHR